MQTTSSSLVGISNRLSGLRIGGIAVGYFLALVGNLSVFRISLVASFLTLVIGFAIVALASREAYAPPRLTWRVGLVWLIGWVMILGILNLIGEDKIRHWTPHPAGYQTAWFICLFAFLHFRQLILRSRIMTN